MTADTRVYNKLVDKYIQKDINYFVIFELKKNVIYRFLIINSSFHEVFLMPVHP